MVGQQRAQRDQGEQLRRDHIPSRVQQEQCHQEGETDHQLHGQGRG